jgi:hypothetical protein
MCKAAFQLETILKAIKYGSNKIGTINSLRKLNKQILKVA